MLLSSHETALPAHTLAPHKSFCVQALPSSQAVVLAELTQPAVGSHESLVHGLLSLQDFCAVPPQTPLAQTSPVVQALPSVHDRLLAAWVQPSLASHASLVHELPSSQPMALPAQVPVPHTSLEVQALPSSQLAVLLALTQAPPLQLSEVQALLSLQFFAAPGTQPLWAHTSPIVQGFPSVHGAVLGVWVQPFLVSHPSSVQALLSLQSTSGPGKQVPLVQSSPTEHTLLSALHGEFSFCAR